MTTRLQIPILLVFLIVVLSGCAVNAPESHAVPDAAPPDPGPVVDSGGPIQTAQPPSKSNEIGPDPLQSIADARAQLWKNDAQLFFVSAFEGDLPDPADRWMGPYAGEHDRVANGLAAAWTFSYAVPDEASSVAASLCDAGIHNEIRDALVVTVGYDGAILAEYVTQNDDEGAPTTGWLTEPSISAPAAAQIAWNQTKLGTQAQAADWAQTFLMADWYEDAATHWVFILRFDAEPAYHVYVDAHSGNVVHEGSPWLAKC